MAQLARIARKANARFLMIGNRDIFENRDEYRERCQASGSRVFARSGISLMRRSKRFGRSLDSRIGATDFRWRQAHVDGRDGDPDQSVSSVFFVHF